MIEHGGGKKDKGQGKEDTGKHAEWRRGGRKKERLRGQLSW